MTDTDDFLITDLTRDGCLIRFSWSDKEMTILEFDEGEELILAERVTREEARELCEMEGGRKQTLNRSRKTNLWPADNKSGEQMRTLGPMSVADLSSTPVLGVRVVIRFVWHVGVVPVTVITTRGRRVMSRQEARLCWRSFRKAGYEPTDVTPFSDNGDLLPFDHTRTEIEEEEEMESPSRRPDRSADPL